MPIWSKGKAGFKDFLPQPPKHHAELLLSYDEYVDSWAELVEGVHQLACDRIASQRPLAEDEGSIAIMANVMVSTVALATRAWNISKPRLRKEVRQSVDVSIARTSFEHFVGDEKPAVDALLERYDSFEREVRSLFPYSENETQETLYKRCSIMARYSIDQSLGDGGNDELVQQLAVSFVEADSLFKRLALSSMPDGNTMFLSHPRFIVLQN